MRLAQWQYCWSPRYEWVKVIFSQRKWMSAEQYELHLKYWFYVCHGYCFKVCSLLDVRTVLPYCSMDSHRFAELKLKKWKNPLNNFKYCCSLKLNLMREDFHRLSSLFLIRLKSLLSRLGDILCRVCLLSERILAVLSHVQIEGAESYRNHHLNVICSYMILHSSLLLYTVTWIFCTVQASV